MTSQLGQLKQAQTTWAGAIEIFQELQDVSDAAVHEDVAWILIGNQTSWDPATTIAIAEDALTRSPDSRPLWIALGAALCRSGNWHEAIDALSEANRLGDGNGCGCFFQAMANWQLGEKPAAADWYARAVSRMSAHGVHYGDLLQIREEADACIGSAIAVEGSQRQGRQEGTGGSTTNFAFTITRFGDTSGSVAVDWATSDGTAKAGRDYVPAAGQLHFESGVTQKRVNVAVYHDYTTERSEDFVVSLVDVAGATVAQRRAIGTILNDDQAERIDKWDSGSALIPTRQSHTSNVRSFVIARHPVRTIHTGTLVERSS